MIIDFYKGSGGSGQGYTKEEVNAIVAMLFDGASYDSSSKRINFLHGSTVLGYIDATDFIKDGMVNNVTIQTIQGVSYLVITFNTDAGKEDIRIALSDIFDATNYYTKTEVDNRIQSAVTTLEGSISDVETATVSSLNQLNSRVGDLENDMAGKADSANTYTKAEIDTKTVSIENTITGLSQSKQDVLTAGTNIDIANNVISVTGITGGTTYQAGQGIQIVNDTISATGITALETTVTTLEAAIREVDRSTANSITTLNNKKLDKVISNDINVSLEASGLFPSSNVLIDAGGSNYQLTQCFEVKSGDTLDVEYNNTTEVWFGASEFVLGLTVELLARWETTGLTAGTITIENDGYVALAIPSTVESAVLHTTTTVEEKINSKQDIFTAGTNIDITNNVISVTGITGGTTYQAGQGIQINNDTISATGITALEESLEELDEATAGAFNDINERVNDLDSAKQDVLSAGTNISISGTTISADLSNYYTKTEIDATIGDINTILQSI